jgi:micrococcal nuclease
MFSKVCRRTLATTIVLLSSLEAQASGSFVGKVVGVQDGDTISVIRTGRAERVRLQGIDAPERGQDFSDRAKQRLSDLVFGKVVHVEVRDIDRYGRTVGRVVIDGRDASLEQVRGGLAWHYTRYSRDATLAAAEREARLAHRGLWAQSSPLPPWEFRRSGSPRQPIGSVTQLAGGAYHGNLRSRVFHAAGCPHYNCLNCQVQFASVDEAEASGYRRHSTCVR